MEGRNLSLVRNMPPASLCYTIWQNICCVIFYSVIVAIGIMSFLHAIKFLRDYIFPPATFPHFSELLQEDLNALYMQAQQHPDSWRKYLEELDINSRSALLMGWYHARLPPPSLQNLSMEWNTLLREGMPNLNQTIFVEEERIFAFASLHPNQLAWHVQMLKYAPFPEGSATNYPLCAIFELNIALAAQDLVAEWGPNFSQILIDYALKYDRYSDFLCRELTAHLEDYKELSTNQNFDFSQLFERKNSQELEHDISLWLETLWDDDAALE